MPIIQGGSLHTGLGTFYDNLSSSTNNNATVYAGAATYTEGTAGSEQTSLSIALTDYRRVYWYVKGGKGSQDGNWYINIEHEGQKLAYGTGNKDNAQWYDQGKENLGAGTFKILAYTANNKFNVSWRVTTMDLDQGENLTGSIISTGVSNVNFGSSYANVNTTAYKWVLPVAGTYMINASLRARIWSDDGFGKIRLYNNTASSASDDDQKMMIELQYSSAALNMGTHFHWVKTVTVPTTYFLQGLASSTSACGIQSDSNGWNECSWLRIR